VMVNFGKTKVFEGKVTKAVDGIVGRECAPAHLFEELADGLSVHRRERSSVKRLLD
jgi:hypothetical protein